MRKKTKERKDKELLRRKREGKVKGYMRRGRNAMSYLARQN